MGGYYDDSFKEENKGPERGDKTFVPKV